MKKYFKSFLISLLVLCSLISSTSGILAEKEDYYLNYKDLVLDNSEAGQINKKINNGKNQAKTKKSKSTEVSSVYEANDSALPTSYSSITNGKASGAKNQGSYGTCWAFSATGSAEAGLYRNTGTMYDLSELQLVYFFYNEKIDPLGNATGDKTTNLEDTIMGQGGNHIFTIWGLANWTNGATEASLPYNSTNITKALNGTLETKYAYDYDVAHLKNGYIIPYSNTDTARNNVKNAVMEYGQVSCSYYHNKSYYNETNGSYYTTVTGTNHAVAIVGWNDNYPASNFGTSKKTRPTKDGAWLVKNNWGTSWGTDGDENPTSSGQEGYFWLSYYDSSLNSSTRMLVYDFDTTDNYQYNYQYDGSCGSQSKTIYAGSKYAAIYEIKGLTSNVEELRAVGIGINQQNVSGRVSIYKNVIDGQPLSGELVTSQSFSTSYAGFYTIDLDEPQIMNKGTKFSIVYEFSTQTSVFVDYSYTNGDWIKFTTNTTNDKTYTISGSNVTSLANSGYTGRIKAYTKDSDEPTVNKYTVNYYGQDATNLPETQYKYEGTALTLSDTIPTKKGYTFKGWDTSSDANVVVYLAGATYKEDSNLDLYAVFEKIEVESISLSKNSLTFLEGKNDTVEITVTPTNAMYEIEYSTNNEGLTISIKDNTATVSSTTKGEYELTFSIKGTDKSVTIPVTVNENLITSITPSVSSISYYQGASGQVTLNISPSDAKYDFVVVDNDGLTAEINDKTLTISGGTGGNTYTVKIKDTYSNLSTDITVKVNEPEKIINCNVTVSKVVAKKKNQYQVKINVTATNTTIKSVKYSTTGLFYTSCSTNYTFTNKTNVTKLYVRVVDGDGKTHNFTYNKGVVTKK